VGEGEGKKTGRRPNASWHQNWGPPENSRNIQKPDRNGGSPAGKNFLLIGDGSGERKGPRGGRKQPGKKSESCQTPRQVGGKRSKKKFREKTEVNTGTRQNWGQPMGDCWRPEKKTLAKMNGQGEAARWPGPKRGPLWN